MHAYKVYGGPCHYDIQLSFYIKLGKDYLKNKVGNINTAKGKARSRKEVRIQTKRLSRQFDKFFNPQKEKGIWKTYYFGECCSFHIDISFLTPPPNATELPPNVGILEVEDLKDFEHPNAKIGGKKLVVGSKTAGHVLAHELGHILGLPDHYRTKDIPELNVQGNGWSKEREKAHRGHLMGKAKKAGKRRVIQQHEIDAIAEATAMVCDKKKCCKKKNKQASLSFPETPKEYAAFLEQEAMALPMIEQRQYFPAHAAILPYSLAKELLGPKLYKKMRKK